MVVEEKYPEVEDVVKDYDEICKICDEMGNFMEQRKNDRTRAGFTAKFNVPFEKTADCIMKEKFPQQKTQKEKFRNIKNVLFTVLRETATKMMKEITSENSVNRMEEKNIS